MKIKFFLTTILFLVSSIIVPVHAGGGAVVIMGPNDNDVSSGELSTCNDNTTKHFLRGNIMVDVIMIKLKDSGEIVGITSDFWKGGRPMNLKKYVEQYHKNHKVIQVQFNFHKGVAYILYVQ